ncbi:MAG: sulfatase, partial [Planctomycetes bacterium]|nr:sulfatase [Planctomycetota bacterium]
AANCQPSRACLLSGQYTPRHSVYAVGSTKRGPEHLMRMIPIPNRKEIPSDNVTIAEALKAGGYATGGFGKWHAGGRARFETTMARVKGNDKKANPKSVYSITRAACDFIEKNKDRPFFAYVSHHAIHSPLESRPETLEKYENKKPGKQHHHAAYAACIWELDNGVGLILKKLEELGLDKKTLVVFTSDNGGTPQSSQEPLRGAKGGYYEAGIREPFVVRWPGVVSEGTRCGVPVIIQDLYPTFLAVAGVKPPSDKVLDGENLIPLLTGQGDLDRKAIFWHFPGYLNTAVPRGRDPVFRTRPVSVIRKGDWKLHLYHEEWVLEGGRDKIETHNAVELYNLENDAGERKNLSRVKTKKRDELLGDLLGWIDAVEAPLPSEHNPAYDPSEPAGSRKKNKSPKKKAAQ